MCREKLRLKLRLIIVAATLVYGVRSDHEDVRMRSAQFTSIPHSQVSGQLGTLYELKTSIASSVADCARSCIDGTGYFCQGVFVESNDLNSNANCTLTTIDSLYPLLDMTQYTSWTFYQLANLNTEYSDPVASCGHTYIQDLNMCISTHTSTLDQVLWEDAYTQCQLHGGYLIDFASSTEFLNFRDYFYNDAFYNSYDWHIGIKSSDFSVWRWNNSGIVETSASIWAANQPDNGYSSGCAGVRYIDAFYLSDYHCGTLWLRYVCRYNL